MMRSHLLAPWLLVSAVGCAFGEPDALTPSYGCDSAEDCGASACVAGYCAQESATPYQMVFRVLPAAGSTSSNSSFTFEPVTVAGSGTLDLTLPDGRIAFGVVRYAGEALSGQMTFRRRAFVAGQFADEQRALIPGVAWAEDGGEADFRLYRSASSAIAVFHPAQSRTPQWTSVPSSFAGRPLAEVFPPVVKLVDASPSSLPYDRYDLLYPTGLFSPCVPGAVACTAVGTVVSRATDGTTRPEPDLEVVFENLDTGEPCSTIARTDANGEFAMRVSSLDLPYRLRISGSLVRPAYPTLVLPGIAYDPSVGGDVAVPRFDAVRYVGRVERAGSPAGDALVRAVSIEQVSYDDSPVSGAVFEATTRTTLSSAPEGAGFFALDLVEGTYVIIGSHAASDSAITATTAVVRRPFAGSDVLGDVLGLGPAFHVGGTVTGPDGRALPYASVDAFPFVPVSLFGTTESYAQFARASSDESGLFDVKADLGRYDLRVEAPPAAGLAPSVALDFSIGGGNGRSYVDVALTRPVVLTGRLLRPDGTPLPSAVIEAYAFVPGDADLVDRTVRIGQLVTDDGGRFVFALPVSIGRLP